MFIEVLERGFVPRAFAVSGVIASSAAADLHKPTGPESQAARQDTDVSNAEAPEPQFVLVSSVTIPYAEFQGSVLASAVLVDEDGTTSIIFNGPMWQDGFVDQSVPFQMVSITSGGQISLSDALPDVQAVHARVGVTADFNGDGRADFFSANHGFDGGDFPGEVNTLLLSSPDGTYVQGQLPEYLDFAHAADAGDIDGDGDIDIYVGATGLGQTGNPPYFLLNDGTGSFLAAHDRIQDAPPYLLVSGTLADVDGDDDLDLIVGGHGDTANSGWIYFNDGAGNFTENALLPPGLFGPTLTVDIEAIDFDNDGDLDLFLAQTRKDPFYNGGAVQVLENDGNGGFTDVTATVLPGQFDQPGDDLGHSWIEFIHTSDLNGDGHLDLVLTRSSAEDQSVWLNSGDGTFQPVSNAALGIEGMLLMPVDYNGDGIGDIVSFSRGLSAEDLTIAVYSNASTPPRDADSDFNGDGRSDILWRDGSGTLSEWLGQENGGFAWNPNAAYQVDTAWSIAGFGDIDGDTRDDILWRHDDGSVMQWLGQSDGGFAWNPLVALQLGNEWALAGIADYNGDGRDDVLWRNDAGAMSQWLGQSDGSFAYNPNAAYTLGPDWQVAGLGDFNGDGRDDILWRNEVGAMSQWLGQSDGTFVYNGNAAYQLPTNWQAATTGDFNGDGRDDMLWRNEVGELSQWLGQADGTFVWNGNAAYQLPTNWQLAGTGDYNGDGRDDLYWRNQEGALSQWLGQDDGTFAWNAAAAYHVPAAWEIQPESIM